VRVELEELMRVLRAALSAAAGRKRRIMI